MSNKLIEIGKVVEIDGLKVQIEANSVCNDLTLIHDGVVYNNVTVGHYIGIIRGPYLLIGRIEREYLVDMFKKDNLETFSGSNIIRKIDVRMLGYFENDDFEIGLIAYPMIYNKAVLLSDRYINSILSGHLIKDKKFMLDVGSIINEKIRYQIDIRKLFNTHIGIFGNTGSGKSNTLAKIYTELFKKHEEDINLSNSKFVVLDFNGEYTNDEVFMNGDKNKKILNVSTHSSKSDKITISKEQFWDIETLSILFSATEKTQKPFLKNAIDYFLDDNMEITKEKIKDGICSAFYNTFFTNKQEETNLLLHLIYDIIGISKKDNIPYYDAKWHSDSNTFYLSSCNYYLNTHKDQVNPSRDKLAEILETDFEKKIDELKIIEKLKIALYSQMIYKLSYGQVNYEHISPLLSRIQSDSHDIQKVIEIGDEKDEKILTVISFKNCNINMKKKLPLLIAKNHYINHRKNNKDKIDKTFHLIIDEAHNILSDQSTREASTWKDYRLEVFEEIIKEGRKFGFYITLASQRPADISVTLISQLHNYFIHRLVSDKDLKIIDNTVSTLDSVSKSSIPSLSPGQCIITGTSFALSIAVKIDKLKGRQVPNSANSDLEALWEKAE